MKKTVLPACKQAGLAALLVLVSGCYAVTSRPEGGLRIATRPTYEERQDFFLWGLVGESHIDTTKVCKHGASQIQSQTTFVDGLLGVVTLGIYAPTSARIWCK